MKKTFLFLFAALLMAAGNATADTQAVSSSLLRCDGLFYDCNISTQFAELAPSQTPKGIYTTTEIVIPTTINVSIGGGQTGSGMQQGEVTYTVISIGAQAFAGATATSITFAEPSNIATIRTQAFSNMPNLTKLVLPASLTTLELSSIILPGLTEIEFLGATPPACELSDADNGAYNPWTTLEASTSPDITITVPEGALAAYQDAPGFGDYFTCLRRDPGPGTGCSDIQADMPRVQKIMRNGRICILRDGTYYDLQGQITE
ncbi:MAG: leucine-rich repeat protein [Paludibacteraceae bacterium]|nr:leucine-rich repeat protein [Paludibacteraceae bacterium]